MLSESISVALGRDCHHWSLPPVCFSWSLWTGGPSCPLTVGSLRLKEEEKVSEELRVWKLKTRGGSKCVGCKRNKNRHKKTKNREERFSAVCLPLSDVLLLHLFSFFFNLFPAVQWSLSKRSTVFSKAMTIFDLSSNQYAEVVLAGKRPTLLNRRVYYIRSGRFSITGKDKYKTMG